MAQAKKRAAVTTAANIGKFSPPYLRGLRDAFTSHYRCQDLQFEDIRKVAESLEVPYLALLIIIEDKCTPVKMADVDELAQWMDLHELTRAQVFGDEEEA